MKNFSVMGGSLKNLIFKRGFPINQHIGVNCLKRGAWTVSDSDLREGGGGVVWRGACYPNANYVLSIYYNTY